ncbi:MAG: hypothetical protein Q9164_002518 [Protoblastenia rupestris]
MSKQAGAIAKVIQPKYWCKHCKTFVKDTKLEKTNHEATPKHQGNLQRFLRQLHHGHEREEREKQRAKSEVDRLNGVVPGSKATNTAIRASAIPQSSQTNRQASLAERKKQLQQLAEMGVAVPEDFRREMAMAGDWQTTAQRVIYDTPPKSEGIQKEEEGEESKRNTLNVGVRKRKYKGQEEEEEAGEKVARRGWGSTTRTYPEAAGEEDDLETLLQNTIQAKRSETVAASLNPTQAALNAGRADSGSIKTESVSPSSALPLIKQEESRTTPALTDAMAPQTTEQAPETTKEGVPSEPGVLFKKRKSKATR